MLRQPPVSLAKTHHIWVGYLWLVEKAEACLWFVRITAFSIGRSHLWKTRQSEEPLFTKKVLVSVPLSELSHQVICPYYQFCTIMSLLSLAPTHVEAGLSRLNVTMLFTWMFKLYYIATVQMLASGSDLFSVFFFAAWPAAELPSSILLPGFSCPRRRLLTLWALWIN